MIDESVYLRSKRVCGGNSGDSDPWRSGARWNSERSGRLLSRTSREIKAKISKVTYIAGRNKKK